MNIVQKTLLMMAIIYGSLIIAFASDMDDIAPITPEKTLQVAEIYNSHYDFVRKMHALDVRYLTQRGYAQLLPSDNVAALRYRIDLRDKNYIDPYGNRYDGVLEYAVTDAEDRVGTIYYLHFSDFSINDVKMKGSKISMVEAMRGTEVAKSCWTICDTRMTNVFADAGYIFEPLLFELNDGTEFSFSQTLKKEVVYDDFGQKSTHITGDVDLVINGESYLISLIQPTTLTAQCRWPESGVATVQRAGEAIAEIVYPDHSTCSAGYELVMADTSILNINTRHGYWQ